LLSLACVDRVPRPEASFMLVVHDYRFARRERPTALVIGNFDGVHRGHREILRSAVAQARTHELDAVLITFEPHPTRVLAPDRASPLLTPIDRKLELLAAAGIECCVVQTFDRAFSMLGPREFARYVLLGLRAADVFIGANFRFGKDRAGDGPLLESLGQELGFRAHVVPAVLQGDEVISSSRVRRALADGDLPLVEAMLGRRFDFDGLVVQGDRRGRQIGFPTANLDTGVEALPRDGVYAVRVFNRRNGPADVLAMDGVMNIGVRPTFRAGRSVEVHILDRDEELYGATLRVECIARVRDEMRFDGVEALRAQIQADVVRARTVLAEVAP